MHPEKLQQDSCSSRPRHTGELVKHEDPICNHDFLFDRRALRERQARLMQERAEAEASMQRELQERQAMEHKARVQERVKKQEAKIRRAAEERMRREKAYQELLSKTRECAFLHGHVTNRRCDRIG